MKQISVAEYEEGQLAVLALDTQGNLYKRKEVTEVFPEGTHWYVIDNADLMSGKRQMQFANTSVGPGGEMWAASSERGGAVLRRLGSSEVDNFRDFVWFRGVSGSWQYLSAHGWRCRKS
ncbi:hypothetical protein J437_LFUL006549 [Ladona fulva]|uniref:Uncharacterized protein n=1 Tax=Ladona fulva TaxID=123851 RepID=A0A8K0KJ67_LADFU|nr:hypothetical protein J437_LFUL006549 [Ladona fulva]